MTKELEKIMKKINHEIYDIEQHDLFSFELGFKAALKLEVLREVPEVYEMIRALEKYKACIGLSKFASEALEPWRNDGGGDEN